MYQGFSHFFRFFASFCVGQIIATSCIRDKTYHENVQAIFGQYSHSEKPVIPLNVILYLHAEIPTVKVSR